MKPQERMRSALLKAQTIVARYITPGRRDCEQTVNDLAKVLDDEKVLKSMKQVEKGIQSAGREDNEADADGWKASEKVARETSKRRAS
jgi:hypothetical protein